MVFDFLIVQVAMAEVYYVGVDVGTASVRAALVSSSGLLKSLAQEPISIWEPHTDHYVQSSTQIWEKCCTVVQVRCPITRKSDAFGERNKDESNLEHLMSIFISGQPHLSPTNGCHGYLRYG